MRERVSERNKGRRESGVGKATNQRVSTFFFTRFPEKFQKYDMWRVFKRWGKVWEIFIVKRKNREGMRYGFVRFLEVRNDKELEKQLANIYIGTVKLHVNIPRFSKGDYTKENYWKNKEQRAKVGDKSTNVKVGAKADLEKHVGKKVETDTSYLQAAKKGLREPQPQWKVKQGVRAGSCEEVWRGRDITVKAEDKEWLKNCYVGRLSDIKMYNKIQQTYLLDGTKEIKLRYIGGDMVLIRGVDEHDVEEMINKKYDESLTIFSSVERWNTNITIGNRLTWIRCSGIPLHVWNRECFSSLVGIFGRLVDIDHEIENLESLEYARLLVYVSTPQQIIHQSRVRINKIVYGIRMMEEVITRMHQCSCRLWRNKNSVEDEQSMPSDIGLKCLSSFSKFDGEIGLMEELKLGGDEDDGWLIDALYAYIS